MEHPIISIKKTLQYWCFNDTFKIPYSNLPTNTRGIHQGLTLVMYEDLKVPPYFEFATTPKLVQVYVTHLTKAVCRHFENEKKPITHHLTSMMKDVEKALITRTGDVGFDIQADPLANDPVHKMTHHTLRTYLLGIQEDLQNQKMFSTLCKDYPNADCPPERKQQIKTLSKKIKKFPEFCQNPYTTSPETPLVLLDAFSTAYKVPFQQRALGSLVAHLNKHYQIEGHSCYPLKKLLKEATYQTSHRDMKDPNSVKSELDTTEAERLFEIIEDATETEYIYLKSIYHKEAFIAKQLKAISDQHSHAVEPSIISELICDYQDEHNVCLTNEQKEASAAIFTTTNILVITGYPGTGKSMVTNCIKYVFEHLYRDKCHVEPNTGDSPILFAAPTGIAATRLGKGKGMTLHRALKVALDQNKEFVFRKNANNPFTNDMIIIDEVSMLDMDLAYRLLSAFQVGKTKLILIGDEHQLQSVGPGDVLRHIIQSGVIKTIHLRKIFRQGPTKTIHPIVNLAKSIIKGRMPIKSQLQNEHITYIPLNDRAAIHKKVLELFTALNGDCQIIFPTKKESTVGSIECNKIIAASKIDGLTSKSKFTPGDKVVCIKNTVVTNDEGEVLNDQSVFNGEIGTIIKIDPKADKITFGTVTGKTVTIKSDALDHGWCITCNKSQGSEYNNVILVLHESQTIMLTRQLVYTAVTRAKKHLYLIATASTLKKAINTPAQPRYSFLSSLIASEEAVTDV